MAKKKKRKLGYLHPLYVPQGIERVVTLAGQIFGKVGKIERALAAGGQAGPYRYFIHWHYGITGNGQASHIFELDHPIRSNEDIWDIQTKLIPEAGYPSEFPVISNFILLDPEK